MRMQYAYIALIDEETQNITPPARRFESWQLYLIKARGMYFRKWQRMYSASFLRTQCAAESQIFSPR